MAAGSAKKKVRVSSGVLAKLLSVTAVRWIGIGLAIIGIVYLCFAATLLRVVLLRDNSITPVKNITFQGSIAPVGAKVLVDPYTPHNGGILDHLKQSLTPSRQASVVTVEAGPIGKIQYAEPILTVDGKTVTNVTKEHYNNMTEGRESNYLKDEYVVRCVKGNCIPGKVFIVSKSHIIGQTLNQ